MCVCLFSRSVLFNSLQPAYQAPLFMRFSRQEYWSVAIPFSRGSSQPRDQTRDMSPALAGGFFITRTTCRKGTRIKINSEDAWHLFYYQSYDICSTLSLVAISCLISKNKFSMYTRKKTPYPSLLSIFKSLCCGPGQERLLKNHAKCTSGKMMFCLWETYSDLIISKLHFYLRHFI